MGRESLAGRNPNQETACTSKECSFVFYFIGWEGGTELFSLDAVKRNDVSFPTIAPFDSIMMPQHKNLLSGEKHAANQCIGPVKALS